MKRCVSLCLILGFLILISVPHSAFRVPRSEATVSTTVSRVDYTATADQTVFPYTFKIFVSTDLKVYVNGTLKTLTTHYTVSGVGNPSGGNVTFLTGLTAGDSVAIIRVLPLTQTTDYVENDPFPAASHENALDRLVMIAQQQADSCLTLARPQSAATATVAAFPSGEDSEGIPWSLIWFDSALTWAAGSSASSVAASPATLLGTASSIFNIDAPAGTVRDIRFMSGGVWRWFIRTDAVAESGSAAGSDMQFISRNDDGGLKDTVLTLSRAYPRVGINNVEYPGNNLDVQGAAYIGSQFSGGAPLVTAPPYGLAVEGGISIGTSAHNAGAQEPILLLGQSASDPAGKTNAAGIYAKDVSGAAQLFALNEAGATVQITGSSTAFAPTDLGDLSAYTYTLSNFTTDGAAHTLDLSSIAPAGATWVLLYVQVQITAGGYSIRFRKAGNSNWYNRSEIYSESDGNLIAADLWVPLSAGRTIDYLATNASWTAINVTVKAWK